VVPPRRPFFGHPKPYQRQIEARLFEGLPAPRFKQVFDGKGRFEHEAAASKNLELVLQAHGMFTKESRKGSDDWRDSLPHGNSLPRRYGRLLFRDQNTCVQEAATAKNWPPMNAGKRRLRTHTAVIRVQLRLSAA
jgi:hypothetical protein